MAQVGQFIHFCPLSKFSRFFFLLEGRFLSTYENLHQVRVISKPLSDLHKVYILLSALLFLLEFNGEIDYLPNRSLTTLTPLKFSISSVTPGCCSRYAFIQESCRFFHCGCE